MLLFQVTEYEVDPSLQVPVRDHKGFLLIIHISQLLSPASIPYKGLYKLEKQDSLDCLIMSKLAQLMSQRMIIRYHCEDMRGWKQYPMNNHRD